MIEPVVGLPARKLAPEAITDKHAESRAKCQDFIFLSFLYEDAITLF